MNKKEINWAVIGCGVIANEMAHALDKIGRKIFSVANRTYDKAVEFAKKYAISKVYKSIDEVFLDLDVDIIYITTPHNTHYQYMKKALENGKHIFVEKSITLNSDELEEMVELAGKNNLMIGEAMTIWHMPLYHKLHDIISNGELGKVQLITMNFGSFKEYDMNNRFFNMNLAGGAMLDIGVYALSIVISFMKEKPNEIFSFWKKSPAGSDEMSTIILKNKSEQMATVALSLHSKQPKRAVISCENGYIEIMEYPRADRAMIVDAVTGNAKEVIEGNREDALLYEIQDMEEAVKSGNSSILHLQETLDVMEIMTKLRKEWNLQYPEEIGNFNLRISLN